MELRNEIETELKEISTYLSSLQRSHPFMVPENYFKELEEALIKTVGSVQVKAIHEGLMNKKEHPFKTPSHYFEDLPENTLSTIHNEKSRSRPLKPSQDSSRNFYKALLAAASVALIAMLVFMMKDASDIANEVTSEQANVQVEGEETFNILGNAAEIDEALVVELLVAERLNMQDGKLPALEDNDPSLMDVIDLDPELLEEI